MSGPFLKLLWGVNLSLVAIILITFVVAAPRTIRRAVVDNCYRGNRTFSARRCRCEIRHVAGFLTNAMFLVALALVAVNSVLMCIHHFVIPIPLAVSAATRFDVDQADWKDNLRDPEEGNLITRYSRWAQQSGYPGATADSLQRFLWRGWALLVVGILVTAWLCWRFLLRSLLGLVREFREQLSQRQWRYYLRDSDQTVSGNQESRLAGQTRQGTVRG